MTFWISWALAGLAFSVLGLLVNHWAHESLENCLVTRFGITRFLISLIPFALIFVVIGREIAERFEDALKDRARERRNR